MPDDGLDELGLHPLVDQHHVGRIRRWAAAEAKARAHQLPRSQVEVGVALDDGRDPDFRVRDEVVRGDEAAAAVGAAVLEDADVGVPDVGVAGRGVCHRKDFVVEGLGDEVQNQAGSPLQSLFGLSRRPRLIDSVGASLRTGL